jgi:N-acetylmuramoyl-L-alanine amidase
VWLGSGSIPDGGWQLTLTHPSPNFGPRRDGVLPNMVVIHYTAMETGDSACRTLCNPATEVSAHYLIDADGTVRSLVSEDMRAWHAGAGGWGDIQDVNSRSIGIELANPGNCPFAMAQMDALVDLLHGIVARWHIKPERIIGHSDMAPGRKIDPGRRFDWRRLWLEGLGVWPDRPSGHDMLAASDIFRTYATAFGYPDVKDDLLLDVMRMRFRPWHIGLLDDVDIMMMADLAVRFPVDVSVASA